MAGGRGRIRRIIELILDPNAARRAERDMQSALRRGTDPRAGTRNLGTIERTWNRLRIAALGFATAAVGGLVLGFRKIARESIEAEQTQAQLAARIKSTGGAAGRTTEQLNDHAEALQKVTTFSDDAIGSAQALLLTFTRIRGEEFDSATEAILDLSTALGQDLNTSATQVGKALNDPIRGVTALSRVGVQFTETQRDTIKSLVETGRAAQAQAIILKQLEIQYGGSAEAARNTLGGALTGLQNAWDELFEVSLSSSSGIVGAINSLADALPKAMQRIDRAFRGIQERWIKAAIFFRTVLRDWSVAQGAAQPQIDALNSSIEEARQRLEDLQGQADLEAAADQAAAQHRATRALQYGEIADKANEAAEAVGLLADTVETVDKNEVLRPLWRLDDPTLAGASTPSDPTAPTPPISGARSGADVVGSFDTIGEVGTSVADGLQSVWSDLFGNMQDGTEEVGFAWLALADIMTGSFGGALDRIAGMKVAENLAHAIEQGARAIAALATGNIAAAGAHGQSAAQFGAAAAAWKGVQGLAGGGGGGGAAGQGITDVGGNIRNAAGGAELTAPQVHVYVDGIDPDNPRHVELVQRTVVNARQQWGDQKPTVRRYASSR